MTLAALQQYAGLSDNPIAAKAVAQRSDFDLGILDLDSLTTMEVAMHIEDTLGLEIDVDDLMDLHSFHALVAGVERMLDERPALQA